MIDTFEQFREYVYTKGDGYYIGEAMVVNSICVRNTNARRDLITTDNSYRKEFGLTIPRAGYKYGVGRFYDWAMLGKPKTVTAGVPQMLYHRLIDKLQHADDHEFQAAVEVLSDEACKSLTNVPLRPELEIVEPLLPTADCLIAMWFIEERAVLSGFNKLPKDKE